MTNNFNDNDEGPGTVEIVSKRESSVSWRPSFCKSKSVSEFHLFE